MMEYSEAVMIGGPPMEVPEAKRYLLYFHEGMIGVHTEVDRKFVQQIIDASNEMTRLDMDRVKGYVTAVAFRTFTGSDVVHFWFNVYDPPSSEELYAAHMKALM